MSDCDTMNCSSLSLLKLMSIESVTPSNHLILGRSLPLSPSIFPSIRVFSNELVLHIRWPKHWSFSFSISPSNEYSGLISFRTDCFDLIAVQEILKSLLQQPKLENINSSVLSLLYGPTLTPIHDYWKNHSFDYTKTRLQGDQTHSVLKEISPEYSLEGLMLKLKFQYFGHPMRRTDSLEKILMLGKTEAGGKGDDRG